MHRFFLENQTIQSNQEVDLAPLAHQLRSVLRLSSGTMIQLLDGRGEAFLTEIQQLDRHKSIGFVHSQAPVTGEPDCHLTLYQCSLKRDKFEWILQKGTELGVSCFVPVISQRSIVRPKEALNKKYQRWQIIIREAAEQCGRGLLPVLASPLDWDEVMTQAKGVRLLPWEGSIDSAIYQESSRKGLQDSFDSRIRPDPCLEDGLAPHLSVAVQQWTNDTTQNQKINLMIGPEGGITQEEMTMAQSSGWQIVSLGKRILRAETAAVASTAIMMSYFDS